MPSRARTSECQSIPRPARTVAILLATPSPRNRSSRCYCLLLIAVFLKVFDRVRDRSKAIDLADMLLDSLRAEPIAHRGTSFDNLQARASCFDVVSHVHDYAARLNVHMW